MINTYQLKNCTVLFNPSDADGDDWRKNCVIYQIYPRSFQDSNGDGVGDLPGIIDRLDYLVELGVDALWLSPIYPSPMADFGYDVADYCDVDPLFGSLADFDRLLAAAHGRNLKVILDYVANHTSHEHPWFKESRRSRDNAKRDWYIWRDGRENGAPPNNWVSFFGGSSWTWDSQTEQYYLHMFSPQQPDLNWRNPEVVVAMHDVLRFWLDRGVDGFRMDAVTMLIKHADMPDMPTAEGLLGAELLGKHIYVHNQPEVHDLIRGFRQVLDSYDGRRVLMGETGDLDPRQLVSFYGRHLDEMHLPFNFIPMHKPWQAAGMRQAITSYYAALPHQATPNFVFGNHDISRLATRYGWANHRSVGMFLLTLGGVATLYYGDELGMTDGVVPPEKMQDLMTQDFSGGEHGRDPARTPMQWSATVHSGFTDSNSDPWLPLAANYETVNVANQAQESESTLKFYQALITLRRSLPALQYGSLVFVDDAPEGALVYLREYNEQRLLIVINFADAPFSLDLSQLAREAVLQLSSLFSPVTAVSDSSVFVQAHESLFWVLD